MTLRVGIDGTSWVNRRGYGRFARNAVPRLVELDPETTYVVYIDEQSAAEADLPSGVEEERIRLARAPTEAAAAESNRSPLDLLRLTRAVRRGRLDAFIFPSVYTYFPVVGTPTIVGVHDAIASELPELTLPTRRARLFWRAKETLALRSATRLFTVSEASRAALARRLSVPEDRFAIVPEAPDDIFFPRTHGAIAPELARIGLGSAEPFFLFAGGISPHKNVETLLEAYASVRSERPDGPRLVIVGDVDADPFLSSGSAVRDRIGRLDIEDAVVLPGYVSDEALACLYSAAIAVVLPSLAEGFGLPAVEAAACGAPTLLSELPAHQENLGNAALYFPPTDVRALTERMRLVLDDSALRTKLSQQGRERVSRLSWDVAGERLRELVHDVSANGRRRRRRG